MSQPVDLDYLSIHYSRLADEELEKLAKSDLVPEARAILQAELERRPIERQMEREAAAAQAAQLKSLNQDRLAAGKIALDAGGKPLVTPVFGVGAARATCSLGIFVAGIFALVTVRAFPPGALLCFALAAWAYWIRRRLAFNLWHAAIEFLAYTAVIGVIIGFMAIPAIDASFSSLRGSSLRGLGYLSIAFLWQLLVALIVIVQLMRRRFLSIDAVVTTNGP